eukprot:1861067-Rhodomonas_salina.2
MCGWVLASDESWQGISYVDLSGHRDSTGEGHIADHGLVSRTLGGYERGHAACAQEQRSPAAARRDKFWGLCQCSRRARP